MFGLKYLISKLLRHYFPSEVFKKCNIWGKAILSIESIKTVPRMFQGTTKKNLEKKLALEY